MLIALTDMDADKVHAITAAVFDHLDEFKAESVNARQIDPADSKNLAIPLHEGAARYFNKWALQSWGGRHRPPFRNKAARLE